MHKALSSHNRIAHLHERADTPHRAPFSRTADSAILNREALPRKTGNAWFWDVLCHWTWANLPVFLTASPAASQAAERHSAMPDAWLRDCLQKPMPRASSSLPPTSQLAMLPPARARIGGSAAPGAIHAGGPYATCMRAFSDTLTPTLHRSATVPHPHRRTHQAGRNGRFHG